MDNPRELSPRWARGPDFSLKGKSIPGILSKARNRVSALGVSQSDRKAKTQAWLAALEASSVAKSTSGKRSHFQLPNPLGACRRNPFSGLSSVAAGGSRGLLCLLVEPFDVLMQEASCEVPTQW